MSARLQSKAVAPRRKRTEVVVLEDDRWVWGAIFTGSLLRHQKRRLPLEGSVRSGDCALLWDADTPVQERECPYE
jgi:hypothetical protein